MSKTTFVAIRSFDENARETMRLDQMSHGRLQPRFDV